MFGFFKKKKQTKIQDSSPSREELVAEAMANARAAREEIGDETLDKIAAAMRKKEQSKVEQAKARIKSMDNDKIADNLRAFLDED